MMRSAMLAVVAAAMLGGCTDYGRGGLARMARYPAMPCEAIDAERGEIETAANALFRKAARKGAVAERDPATVMESWPSLIFTRDNGPRDRQRYEQLSLSYEQLRIAARQKGCQVAFASDVSATVRSLAAD